MRRLLIILRREFFAQLLSPVSWLLMTLVWLIYGVFYRWTIIENPQAYGDILRMTWQAGLQALWIQLFLVPLQTMRLISEEKRSGTFEMLVTTPVRDHEIVLGKFFGAWLFNALIWLVMPLYACIIQRSGGDPDFGPVWTSYLAVVATGALYISVGLMASALTRPQILAGFLGIALLVLIGVLPNFWSKLPEEGFWSLPRGILKSGDLTRQMEEAARGLLDVVHLTYKLAFCGLFLLFTTRLLEVRKWA
ncbi:MAG: hypothetical protein CMJ83_08100 [Planctomycetes bacterium]|nr:hypothetical protein [Planctomycetota bacterium]